MEVGRLYFLPGLLCVFLLFALSRVAVSQSCKIGGWLKDATDGMPLIAADVLLYQADSVTLVNFASTDEEGRWQMIIMERGDYVLSFSALGFKASMSRIRVDGDSLPDWEHSLEAEEYLLPEAAVSADRVGVRQLGDTIYYDVKAFTNGKEENLGDILAKLPGISVDEKGEVYYNGKRVGQLLLHGREALGQSHRHALEGIQAGDIKGVRILEQYRTEAQRLLGTDSERVALDVVLEDGAKSKWRGEVSLGSGTEWHYESDNNLYKSTDKTGMSVYLKSNNTQTPVLTMSDYLGITLDLFSLVEGVGDAGASDLKTLVPEHFRNTHPYVSNTGHMGSFNMDKELDGKNNLKVNLLLSGWERESRLGFVRDYALSPFLEHFGESQIADSGRLGIANIEYRHKPHADRLLEVRGSIDLNGNDSGTSTEGYFSDKPNLFRNTQNWDAAKAGLDLKHTVRHGEAWSTRQVLRYKFSQELFGNNLQDTDTIYSIGATFDGGQGMFRQDGKVESHQFSTQADVVRRAPKTKYVLRVGYSHHRYLFDYDALPWEAQFTGTDLLSDNMLHSKFTCHRELPGNFKANAEADIAYVKREATDRGGDFLTYRAGVSMVRRSGINFDIINFKHHKSIPDLHQMNTLGRSMDVNQYGTGFLYGSLPRHTSVIGYQMMRGGIGKHSRIRFGVTYSHARRGWVEDFLFFPTHVVSHIRQIKKSDNISGTASVRLNINKEWQQHVNFRSSLASNHFEDGSGNRNLQNQLSLGYDSRYKGWFDFRMSQSLALNKISSTSGFGRTFLQGTTDLAVLLKKETASGAWSAEIPAGFIYTLKSASQAPTYVNLSPKVGFTHNKGWGISMESHDILNLSPVDILSWNQQLVYSEEQRHATMGGYVLIMVSYKL